MNYEQQIGVKGAGGLAGLAIDGAGAVADGTVWAGKKVVESSKYVRKKVKKGAKKIKKYVQQRATKKDGLATEPVAEEVATPKELKALNDQNKAAYAAKHAQKDTPK